MRVFNLRLMGALSLSILLIGCQGLGTPAVGSSSLAATGSSASPGSTGTPQSFSQCTPSIPQLSWTNPYAGFSRGPSANASYFPLAVWLQQSDHAQEMSQMGINLYIGNNAGTDPLQASDLTVLASYGISAIVQQDSVGLASVDSSTIVGWWMTPDEPDNAQPDSSGGYGPAMQPSVLMTEYDSYKSTDSTRPAYLGLGQGVAYDNWEGRGSNAPPESEYVPASDIISFDIYPYNACGGDANQVAICGEFWLNAFGISRLLQWSTHNQAAWTWIETTDMDGDGNGPTPAETASEVWLSLIHGANGIGYFVDVFDPSFREDGIFENPTMVAAVTALNQQIKSLAPELNSASLANFVTVTPTASGETVDSMVKASGSSIYIFAAISSAGTTGATIAVNGMTGNDTVQVIGENRTLSLTNGQFSDSFAANGYHIYKIDLSAATCN